MSSCVFSFDVAGTESMQNNTQVITLFVPVCHFVPETGRCVAVCGVVIWRHGLTLRGLFVWFVQSVSHVSETLVPCSRRWGVVLVAHYGSVGLRKQGQLHSRKRCCTWVTVLCCVTSMTGILMRLRHCCWTTACGGFVLCWLRYTRILDKLVPKISVNIGLIRDLSICTASRGDYNV